MQGHFEDLLKTIKILRAPGGCPWDRKQTLLDAARYLMDEAGELVEAALADDIANTREELADLLFMTCFCCEILGDRDDVTMYDIARQGNEKLVRRHPHVFGNADANDSAESQERWNAIKAQEKRDKGLDPSGDSVLKDMPASVAPLHQAYRYQKDAANVGFDWPEISGVWNKLDEEMDELKAALADGDPNAMEHELGDVLFSMVNLSRWLKIQPDMALRRANTRFRNRFHLVEADYGAKGKYLKDASIDELEAAWQAAKDKLAKDAG